MGEEAAFVQAIVSDPSDLALRLVYADWLEERGDPRGEYLRLACALASADESSSPVTRNTRSRSRLEARLRELRSAIDGDWLALMDGAIDQSIPVMFRCARCYLPITRVVSLLVDEARLVHSDGADLVPQGYCWRATKGYYLGIEGHFCINLKDLVNTMPHPDMGRRVGCCGPSGDAVNTVCTNGHEVGSECSECYMPHYLHLEPYTFIISQVRDTA
jgi:uncharacterized protein (TIGR02996 family)